MFRCCNSCPEALLIANVGPNQLAQIIAIVHGACRVGGVPSSTGSAVGFQPNERGASPAMGGADGFGLLRKLVLEAV